MGVEDPVVDKVFILAFTCGMLVFSDADLMVEDTLLEEIGLLLVAERVGFTLSDESVTGFEVIKVVMPGSTDCINIEVWRI